MPRLPFLLLLALLAAATPVLAADIVGRATVIDGDTLDISGIRIRLFGVDAPEGRQTCADARGQSYYCGSAAALALAEWIGQRTVTCRAVERDGYGRVVATCAVQGEDAGDWLVRHGYALDYQQYSGGRYAAAERAAAAAKAGIWQGAFTPPWAWRRDRRG